MRTKGCRETSLGVLGGGFRVQAGEPVGIGQPFHRQALKRSVLGVTGRGFRFEAVRSVP